MNVWEKARKIDLAGTPSADLGWMYLIESTEYAGSFTGEALTEDEVKLVATETTDNWERGDRWIIRWSQDELAKIKAGWRVCNWCPELSDPDNECHANWNDEFGVLTSYAGALNSYSRRTNLTNVADNATLSK